MDFYSYGYELPDALSPIIASFGLATYMVSLAIGILSIVALWMVFQKAGEEGWAAIIPLYNSFVLYKITWGNGWFFLLLLIPLANIVISIITLVGLARVFGKGGGFACGLIFLNTIFMCILAFDKSIVYVGVDGKGYAGAQSRGFQSPYSQTATQQSSQSGSYFYQQTSASNSPKFCPRCGTALEPGVKYCPSCGQAL